MPLKDKEKQKEWSKQYYLKNKEKIDKNNKEWKLKNKDKHKEYDKAYRKTETGKKNKIIIRWKEQGIIFDNQEEADFYYENYIKSTKCNWCDKEYEKSINRHLDHHHLCGRPRAIICRSCNLKDIVPCVLCLNS